MEQCHWRDCQFLCLRSRLEPVTLEQDAAFTWVPVHLCTTCSGVIAQCFRYFAIDELQFDVPMKALLWHPMGTPWGLKGLLKTLPLTRLRSQLEASAVRVPKLHQTDKQNRSTLTADVTSLYRCRSISSVFLRLRTMSVYVVQSRSLYSYDFVRIRSMSSDFVRFSLLYSYDVLRFRTNSYDFVRFRMIRKQTHHCFVLAVWRPLWASPGQAEIGQKNGSNFAGPKRPKTNYFGWDQTLFSAQVLVRLVCEPRRCAFFCHFSTVLHILAAISCFFTQNHCRCPEILCSRR